MRSNCQNLSSFAFLLVAGLVSGCGDEPPPELVTMFPGEPHVALAFEQQPGALERACVAECCGIPEDGIVVFYVGVENWLLAPHEECGDEPQCGPVRIRTPPEYGIGLEVETVEDTVAVNVLELVAEQGSSLETWPTEWIVIAEAVPRPEIEDLYALDVINLALYDEAGQRGRDFWWCNGEEGRFHVYVDLGPDTEPGSYVMRASLDDVEVTCALEVLTREDGDVEFAIPPDDACAPVGLLAPSVVEIADSPEAPAGHRRVRLDPRDPVERVSVEITRAGEILVTGSHEPANELAYPRGEECTIVPCQISPAFGVTL